MNSKAIVLSQKNQLFADSRDLAAFLGKRHSDVIRAIENLKCEKDFRKKHIIETVKPGKNSQGISTKNLYKTFSLTKEGVSYLIMSLKGEKYEKFKTVYIQAFEAMEAKLALKTNKIVLPKTFAQALQLAADQALKLEKQKPLVDFAESVKVSENSISVGKFAKTLGVGRNHLFSFLREKKYLASGKNLNMAFDKYMKGNRNYFEYKTLISKKKDNKVFTTHQLLVTGKGQIAITKAFNKQKHQNYLISAIIHV